jgi:hypothetical protein
MMGIKWKYTSVLIGSFCIWKAVLDSLELIGVDWMVIFYMSGCLMEVIYSGRSAARRAPPPVDDSDSDESDHEKRE